MPNLVCIGSNLAVARFRPTATRKRMVEAGLWCTATHLQTSSKALVILDRRNIMKN